MLRASIPVAEAVFSYVSTPFWVQRLLRVPTPALHRFYPDKVRFSEARRGAVSAERAAFPKKGLLFRFK